MPRMAPGAHEMLSHDQDYFIEQDAEYARAVRGLFCYLLALEIRERPGLWSLVWKRAPNFLSAICGFFRNL